MGMGAIGISTMRKSLLFGIAVCVASGLIGRTALAESLGDYFERLCATEAGFKAYQPSERPSSLLFKGDVVNRKGNDAESFVLEESGCTLTCQYWLEQDAFDFLEAEIDMSRPAAHRFFIPRELRIAASNQGRSTFYLRYTRANPPGSSCKFIDPKNFQNCLKVELIDAPSSKFIITSTQAILGRTNDFVLQKRSFELRTIDGGALAARQNTFVYQQQNPGFGRNSKKCLTRNSVFPTEFLSADKK